VKRFLHLITAFENAFRATFGDVNRVLTIALTTHFLNPGLGRFLLRPVFRDIFPDAHLRMWLSAIAIACFCFRPDLINSLIFLPTFFFPHFNGMTNHLLLTT
jgi:hypothetical protein